MSIINRAPDALVRIKLNEKLSVRGTILGAGDVLEEEWRYARTWISSGVATETDEPLDLMISDGKVKAANHQPHIPIEPALTPETIDLMLRAREKQIARARTADYLIEHHHFLTTRDNQTLMVYENGYYHNSAHPIILEEVNRLWGDETKTQDIQEIMNAHLKPKTFIDREDLNKQKELTCILNGALNLITGELEEHSPDYKFTFQLPVTYTPGTECPEIEAFLKNILMDENDIRTVYEVLGYCLWRDYPIAKAIVLLGEGRNGKSTLINLIKAFLGEKNVRGMSIHQLEHDAFSKSHLFGIHANMNPDVGNKKIKTTGAIKSLTGNDNLDVNVKHQDYMRFKNYAKLIFASNDLPQSDDNTYAWISRWVFIKFPHNFDGEPCTTCHYIHDTDKNILDKLITPEELSGLLNKSLAALQDLMNNNWDFHLSDYVKKMEREYARISDSAKAFIEDWVVEDLSGGCDKNKLYQAYSNYASDLGDVPIKINSFTQKIKQCHPGVKETRTGNNRRWVGITLKDETIQCSLDEREDGTI